LTPAAFDKLVVADDAALEHELGQRRDSSALLARFPRTDCRWKLYPASAMRMDITLPSAALPLATAKSSMSRTDSHESSGAFINSLIIKVNPLPRTAIAW
jgi:hypothetical protein